MNFSQNGSTLSRDLTSEPSPQLGFLRGTLAPLLRASDRPIAIACLRLVTTPPLPFFPERSLPRFSRCSAFLTLSLAALPYFAIAPPLLRFRALQLSQRAVHPPISWPAQAIICSSVR